MRPVVALILPKPDKRRCIELREKKMSIRVRMIILIVVCTLLLISVISYRVQRLVSEAALENFQANAREQSLRINDIINTYLRSGEITVKTLAKRPELLAARDKLTSFVNTTTPTPLVRDNFSPEVRNVYDLLFMAKTLAPNVDLVLFGQEDGGYIRSAANVVGGYDPRVRVWYKLALDVGSGFAITDPYVSTTNEIVVTVSAPVKDNGKIFGVTGVDFIVQPLVETLNNTVIGKRGYFILLDNKGMVIADPKESFDTITKQYRVLKKPLPEPVFSAISNSLGGLLELTREGVPYVAYVVNFDYVGWKGAVLLPLDEVHEGARVTIGNILFISAIGALIMIFLAATQTTLITKPIYRLMDRLHRVAGKDFTVFDNTPREKLPEIQNLNASVLAMIVQIRELIQSSEQKTREAQEQRYKTEEALALAEVAQKTALHAQENAELARELAEHANKAKSEFLFNMSHEIRTPLNAIIGMTDIGIHTGDPEKKRHCLQRIGEASTHLLGIINDILDMSKIEANKLELAPRTFSFEKMLQRVVNVILFRVEEKNMDFHLRIDQSIPDALVGDDQRLAQIIANLMSNAVKFTPECGSVLLDARLEEEKDGLCRIRISVTDSGIGISEDQQAKLFAPFQQADNSTSRRFGGTGLGLAISKRLVEMMDGQIWIQSELNKGATFLFTAQLACAAAEQMRVTLPGHLADLRVCMLSASQDLCEYLQDCFRKFGVTFDSFANTEKLMTRIRQQAPYTLCFIDWRTVAPAGIHAVLQIGEANGSGTIVMMASALEWNSIESDMAALGIHKNLSKPFFPSDVFASLTASFTAQDAPQTEDAHPVESFQGHRVLLAEDNEINREIVRALFEPTGLLIDSAVNGKEAVQMFSDTPEAYDLILMDIQMPEMDGFTATRRIRALEVPGAKTIPIVAMTANVFSEDVVNCLEAGMTDHVGKPLEMRIVFEKLHRYLSEKP